MITTSKIITRYRTPDLDSDSFLKQYSNDHAVCPKCGSTAHSSTYVGYIVNMDDKDSYCDENTCVCSDCGDRHITHDRVPVK